MAIPLRPGLFVSLPDRTGKTDRPPRTGR